MNFQMELLILDHCVCILSPTRESQCISIDLNVLKISIFWAFTTFKKENLLKQNLKLHIAIWQKTLINRTIYLTIGWNDFGKQSTNSCQITKCRLVIGQFFHWFWRNTQYPPINKCTGAHLTSNLHSRSDTRNIAIRVFFCQITRCSSRI